MLQISIQLARSILYSMSFINYDVMPMYFAQFWSIMLVHQILICCQEDIKFSMNNSFPAIIKERIQFYIPCQGRNKDKINLHSNAIT